MAHIVTEPCIKCKYTDCVAVCPVECFYEGANFLVIHPDECIDCGACVPVCPTTAIFALDDVPEQWKDYAEINAQYAQTWPKNPTAKRDPLPEAEQFKDVADKKAMLDPAPFAG
jgi:ferredoxin